MSQVSTFPERATATPEVSPATFPLRPRGSAAFLRRRLGTLSIVAAVALVSLASMRTGVSRVGTGPFDLRDMFLSLLRVDHVPTLAVILAATLLVCGFAEGAFGTRRLLATFFGGGLVVGVLGLAVGVFEEQVIPAIPLNDVPVSGAPPIAGLLTVAIAASCFASPLWRRRIRLGSVVFALTLFLYAASASDMYTLIALPVGAGVGLLLGGSSAPGVLRSSLREKRVLLAALTAIIAVGPVIATLWGSGAGLLSVYGWLSYDPLATVNGVVCAIGSNAAPCPSVVTAYAELQPWAGWIALLPQLVLLIAAWGILRGRRGALHLAVVVNVLTFVAMVGVVTVSEIDTLEQLADVRAAFAVVNAWQTVLSMVVGAILPLAAAVVLVRFRSAAQIPSARAVRRRFAATIAGAAAACSALALVGILAFSGGFRPWPDLSTLIASLPLRLVPPSLLPAEALAFVPVTGAAQAAWYLPPLLFWIVVVVATVRFIAGSRAEAGTPDRRRAQALLSAGSADTLGHMALWEGNSYWFSPDARAAVAYRVRGGFAVTLGGPFGPDRDAETVGRDFVDFCERHGWAPVFYSVDEADRTRLEPLGWPRLQVAEEAFLDPTTWTPAGKKRQDVRTATNRAEREGVTAEWTRWSALSFLERSGIRDISEAWVADKTIPEMGFTLGSTDQIDDTSVRLLLARDAHGRIVAFTSWIPIHRDGAVAGYALDVMRRRDEAMNGVMEFLIGRAVEQLRADGMTVMSLSGSPLARHSTVAEQDRSPWDRGLDTLSALLEPAYGFRSLANFKKKFQPEFSPLWMVYPDATQLPAIAIALIRCYIPGLTLRQAAQLGGALRRAREGAGA